MISLKITILKTLIMKQFISFVENGFYHTLPQEASLYYHIKINNTYYFMYIFKCGGFI